MSDDDLPSLKDIFSRARSVKKAKIEAYEKENINSTKILNPEGSKNPKMDDSESLISDRVCLRLNTGVFVKDPYYGKYVPGIVINAPDCDKSDVYSVKLYDGRVERLGRRFILCPDDTEFYSVKVIPLDSVLSSDQSLVRKLNKAALKLLVKTKKEELIGILKGSVASDRDKAFRSSSHSRMSLNSENPPGPFSIEEHKFLMEYFADEFVPEIIGKNDKLHVEIEERFEKTGKPLSHLLRQYSYTVLVPEFVARKILDLDENIKTIPEAFDILYNNSHSFDLETGNFINYLYSKQELYRYARRERSSKN